MTESRHRRKVSKMDAAVQLASPGRPTHSTSPPSKKRKVGNHQRTGSVKKTAGDALVAAGNEEINQAISKLKLPDRIVQCAIDYSNDRNAAAHGGGVQAYAKLAGCNWTYYVRQLSIKLGRMPVPIPEDPAEQVDLDLGPAKSISRLHAVIVYDLAKREWQLRVLGRNGVRVNLAMVREEQGNVTLRSGNVLEIAGVEMMIVFPDSATLLPLDNNGTSKPSVTDTTTASLPPLPTSASYPKGVTILARPAEETRNQPIENDLSLDTSRDIKPPYSYATIIAQAILANSEQKMTLSSIYSWISAKYAYYRFTSAGWQVRLFCYR